MGRIKVERLEIDTVLPVGTLLHMESEMGANEHGICLLIFQLAGGLEQEEIMGVFQDSPIKVWEREGQGGQDDIFCPLFAGYVEDVSLKAYGGSYCAEVRAVTGSIKLDRTARRRSFQSPGMTYHEIAEQVVSGQGDAQLVWNLDESSPGGILVQYDETDWEFLIRLASHLNGSIMVDEQRTGPRIYVGAPKPSGRETWEDTIWECGISPKYYMDGHWPDRDKKDYIYYAVKRHENCQIGMAVTFLGENRIIYGKKVSFEKGEVGFYYRLGSQAMFHQKKKHNEIFGGMQLEGEVESTERETVCLRLNIDGEDGRGGYPYPWKPVTGNLFYCMPETGTKVFLRFRDKDERNAEAIDSVRANGDTCGGYGNPQNRVFEAVSKKTLQMFPEELAVFGSKEGKQPEVSMRDDTGISMNTHKSLTIKAAGNIILKAGTIQCSAPDSIWQKVSRSSMEVHQDFNFYSPGGVENTKSVTAVAGMNEEASRRKMKNYTPCYQAGYGAIGAVAAFGGNMQEAGAAGQAGIGSLPTLGTGSAVAAMAHATAGMPLKDNPFASAFKTIEINTLNGGYPLPEKEAEDERR